MDIHQIRKAIIAHVAASAFKITPHHLEKTITETHSLDKPRTKALLKDLVAQGELEYAYEFGSCLEKDINKKRRASQLTLALF